MKKHVYRVKGHTKKGARFVVRAIDLEADSKKEAIATAKALWEDYRPDLHMFRLEAERRDDAELEFNFWKPVGETIQK